MNPTPTLGAHGLHLGYGDRSVVRSLHLDIRPGSIVALVGPNGSGKSTVLRSLARLHTPLSGTVLLDGRPIAERPTREVARRLGVLPQDPGSPDGLTVRELVQQGRYPHLGPLRPPGAADREAVDEALRLTDTAVLAERQVGELSGGERQRVWLALVLAQEARTLLLDEPTTFLDVGHQLEVMELIARLRRERALTVVVVLHDLDHASRFADRIVALRDGEILADGAPQDVVTPDLLAALFRVRASVITDPETGRPVCLVHQSLAG
ncbi:ABC transporter ATP-binding protein [Nitriliruptor alkaliphilus]|uniref:ABC transporter ATP-binding protein n=1 Tax=Nitriliruptor alkaliphilus TaxID=427918 RepID=UPI000697F6DF|nr:ABC transporter ATP-binding protein [Nitriliruptor alkaliphilus]